MITTQTVAHCDRCTTTQTFQGSTVDHEARWYTGVTPPDAPWGEYRPWTRTADDLDLCPACTYKAEA